MGYEETPARRAAGGGGTERTAGRRVRHAKYTSDAAGLDSLVRWLERHPVEARAIATIAALEADDAREVPSTCAVCGRWPAEPARDWLIVHRNAVEFAYPGEVLFRDILGSPRLCADCKEGGQ